jgi:hypothetical protein
MEHLSTVSSAEAEVAAIRFKDDNSEVETSGT